MLAVTRSLGDSAMKEFVVGSPYTTETTMGDDDDVLIIACDGVSTPLSAFLFPKQSTNLLHLITALGRDRRPSCHRSHPPDPGSSNSIEETS